VPDQLYNRTFDVELHLSGKRVNRALTGSLVNPAPISGKMAGQAALGSSMSRNRFKSIALYGTVGIRLLLVFVGLLFAVEQRAPVVLLNEVTP
jgi:hypothetical protein